MVPLIPSIDIFCQNGLSVWEKTVVGREYLDGKLFKAASSFDSQIPLLVS